MYTKREYIKENLDIINKMIENKCPKFEIARVLRVKYSTLDKYLKEFGIIYKGNPHRKGIPHLEGRIIVEEYLAGKRNVSAPTLRTKLIENGLKEEKCECCGLSEWMGKKIPLELHHKNMNHNDNRLENLLILCSNCHSLAHNYSNINNKPKSVVDIQLFEHCMSNNYVDKPAKQKKERTKRVIRYCKHCGMELKRGQKVYCSQICAHLHVSKIPPKDELINKLEEFKWNKRKTGKYFNVSDNSIKKWIKKYGIIK